MTIKERNALLIESVVLTEEELKEAITEGKRKKYFKEKHKTYWHDQENTDHTKASRAIQPNAERVEKDQ